MWSLIIAKTLAINMVLRVYPSTHRVLVGNIDWQEPPIMSMEPNQLDRLRSRLNYHRVRRPGYDLSRPVMLAAHVPFEALLVAFRFDGVEMLEVEIAT
jgi:hypothetical protein